jgi:cytochrome P450
VNPITAVTYADPYPYYAELVATRPLHRDDALGLWVAASAEAVRAVLTSDLCRVRPEAEPVPRLLLGSPAGNIFGQLIRMTDGPGHLPAKLAVSGHLGSMTPALIVQQSRAWAQRLAEELDPARHIARLADFAFRLPVHVIASLLGFAPDRLPELVAWTDDFVRCLSPASTPEQIEQGKAAASYLVEAFQNLLGRPTLDVVVANRIGYLSQAYEATAGLIGNTIVALGRQGDVRDRAGSEPAFLTAVIREVARHDAPIQNTRRFLGRPGTVAGQALRVGDTVLVVLAAANRDPAANLDPDRFDPHRRERLTFTFGLGVHACPGETLATIVAQACVEQLLAARLDFAGTLGTLAYRPSGNARIPLFGLGPGGPSATSD